MSLQGVELRLPMEILGREPSGRPALFRPVDGSRLVTDFTVIVDELLPALVRALETLAEPVASEAEVPSLNASTPPDLDDPSQPGLEPPYGGAASL